MKGGWLEHEIRSLPQVLACSITKDDVVVLVHPSADPVTVERSVEELLRRSGVDRPVRVFGGARPVFVEPVKVRNGGRSALVGTIGGAAILAAGVWLAGAATGLRGGTKTKATVAALTAPVAREFVNLPVVGGNGPTLRPPPLPPQEDRLPPLLRPAGGPIFGARPPGAKPPTAEPPTAEPPTSKPPANPPTASACNAPHDGEAVKPKRGGGNGPPSWSHSIHVPAHCTTGRPR